MPKDSKISYYYGYSILFIMTSYRWILEFNS